MRWLLVRKDDVSETKGNRCLSVQPSVRKGNDVILFGERIGINRDDEGDFHLFVFLLLVQDEILRMHKIIMLVFDPYPPGL